jgi:hypothetical protein
LNSTKKGGVPLYITGTGFDATSMYQLKFQHSFCAGGGCVPNPKDPLGEDICPQNATTCRSAVQVVLSLETPATNFNTIVIIIPEWYYYSPQHVECTMYVCKTTWEADCSPFSLSAEFMFFEAGDQDSSTQKTSVLGIPQTYPTYIGIDNSPQIRANIGGDTLFVVGYNFSLASKYQCAVQVKMKLTYSRLVHPLNSTHIACPSPSYGVTGLT